MPREFALLGVGEHADRRSIQPASYPGYVLARDRPRDSARMLRDQPEPDRRTVILQVDPVLRPQLTINLTTRFSKVDSSWLGI
jgi:hypothetical protein